MLTIPKRCFDKLWMMSDEKSMIKQRFFAEHLPRLKQTGENGITNRRLLKKQPELRNSSIFPPVSHNLPSRTSMTTSASESFKSSITYNSTLRQSLTRNNLSSLSPRSSLIQIANNALHRRSTRYEHILPKINTGLPRLENLTPIEGDTYQLKPTRPLNWSLLKQELEQDTQIRAQAKRIQFNTAATYTTQLTNFIRSKIKSHISSVMSSSDERYKIIVQLNIFQPIISGLHIASRCLWNTYTDNSITIKMQGVDCNLLIVIFLCYTDLGAI